MKHPVRVFEVFPPPAPGYPPPKPVENEDLAFVIEDVALHRAKKIARDKLKAMGRKIRSISFLEGGGLVAYIKAEAG